MCGLVVCVLRGCALLSPLFLFAARSTEDGTWLPWTTWTTCSATCGGGGQQRERRCDGVLHGGQNCTGPSSQSRTCNQHECPGTGPAWLGTGGFSSVPQRAGGPARGCGGSHLSVSCRELGVRVSGLWGLSPLCAKSCCRLVAFYACSVLWASGGGLCLLS